MICVKFTGSVFYNYKGTFSIVLFALVDANYQFIFVDIGQPGSRSDASIWQDSKLRQALDSGALNLPDPVGSTNFHFIGDEIFPLMPNLMKPFARRDKLNISEKVYNYR